MEAVVRELWSYWEGGGFVMPPLVGATVLLWFALGWRYIAVRRGSRKTLRQLVEAAGSDETADPSGIIGRAVRRGLRIGELPVDDPRPLLDDAFQGLRDEMDRFSTLVTAIVAAAPLTGLLGTVTGMIETFDSLGDMALFSQSGGIAGGISVALISTQMGLAVAIPGMLVGKMIDRRQEKLEDELQELKELLAARGKNEGAGG
jgi:biopolymer transport protein ExbB